MKLVLNNKKLTAIGGSFGFIVEKQLINLGMVSPEKEYNITIAEAKK